jgi:hypothetical protein
MPSRLASEAPRRPQPALEGFGLLYLLGDAQPQQRIGTLPADQVVEPGAFRAGAFQEGNTQTALLVVGRLPENMEHSLQRR